MLIIVRTVTIIIITIIYISYACSMLNIQSNSIVYII